MPVSASAGCNVRVVGEPEWTPMPATVTGSCSVVCLPAGTPLIMPSSHLTATTRTEYFANRWPPRHEGNAFLCKQGLAYAGARYSIPQTSPRTGKPYWRGGVRPIHAFLPTVTFFRPHCCRLAAANRFCRNHCRLARCKNPSRRVYCGGTDSLREPRNINVISSLD